MIALIAMSLLGFTVQDAYAVRSNWSSFVDWMKSKTAQPPPEQKPAPEKKEAPPSAPTAPAPAPTPTKSSPAPLPSTAPPAIPRWTVTAFPDAAIAQKNYEPIRLSQYVQNGLHNDHFVFSLTPGKATPNWAHLQPDGQLIILTDKISPEDVDTTQVIYLTAISTESGRSASAEITLKITPNDQLPAPQWQTAFVLPDAIVTTPYALNLSSAVNTNDLKENDELLFQLVNTPANWLQIGDNGFSLVSKKIPEEAAGHAYDVTLRVTSKMSGKSADFNGKLYVNEAPKPLQWLPITNATLNQPYTLDLERVVNSNIKNDRFVFDIDVATLPGWLSVKDHRILTGIPQNAELTQAHQKIHVTATSIKSHLKSATTLYFKVNPNPRLMPRWKKDFLPNTITNEAYRSEDLISGLENNFSHDRLRFEYLSGPDWLNFNELCRCLTSKNEVPASAAGQSYVVKLRAQSLAGGKSIDYEQILKAYSGIPQWVKTVLPDVKIGQSANLNIPLNDYVQDDISGDRFTYTVDPYHSPQWVSIETKNGKSALVIHPKSISVNEVDTAQTVRLIATSQSTHKVTAQLFVISVKSNPDLPRPAWKGSITLPIATVGVSHAADLAQYMTRPLPDDQLRVTLGPESPSWLEIAHNKLMGVPPRDAIGGPYPVTLIVHSQAANTDTVIQVKISVQLVVVLGDNMETHTFLDNHQSIVIRGLQKNHAYRLFEVKGAHFDYGPFYSPYPIKNAEDWNGNPFYAVGADRMIKTGDDGVVSIIYYTTPMTPPPQFELVILR